MPGTTETEVKVRLGSLPQTRLKLESLGAALARARHLEDNVLFDDEQGSLRARGGVLRLRETPHGGYLTFKGPRESVGGVKMREERETAVADAAEVRAILGHLGYRPVFRYQKYRESWVHRGQEIELDETPIGAFLEIEGDLAGISAVAAELGFEPKDYVAESYVGLYFASGGTGDMVFG